MYHPYRRDQAEKMSTTKEEYIVERENSEDSEHEKRGPGPIERDEESRGYPREEDNGEEEEEDTLSQKTKKLTDRFDDMTWKNAGGPVNISWIGEMPMDKFLVHFYLTQGTYNVISIAFICSWFGEWACFIYSWILSFLYNHMTGDGPSIAILDFLWKVHFFMVVVFELVFYFSQWALLLTFIFLVLITVYLRGKNPRAYRGDEGVQNVFPLFQQ